MTDFAELNGMLAGHYRIEREIGRGGMAVVYLTRDLRHERSVALKVMHPGLGALLGAERFLAEIRVTANLQHPNILPLFDSGAVGEHLFYVMPYVEGESLRERLTRERALPVEDAVHIASRVAAALDYAHRQGVVHRDLKPENILLRDGEPLIADFGIALAVSRSAGKRMTQSGISLGTPQYMSPEQASGEAAIDGRSDLFSLGAVLYEMLAGEPPHSGPTAQSIVARVIGERPRRLRETRTATPAHVERAVALALEKLPADRPQTGRAFVDALNGRDPVEATATVAPPGSSRSRLWRALPWGIAVSAVGITTLMPRDRPEPAMVRFELTVPTDRSTPDVSGSVAVAPDGLVIALALRDDAGKRRIYLRALADTQFRALEGTEGASQLFFSPDGGWIGFYDAPHLKKVRVEGGAPLLVGEVPEMLGASWAPDRRIVVSTRGRLAHIAEGGGSPQPFTAPDTSANELTQRWPLVLPDGQTIAYTARGRIVEESYIALARFDGSTRISTQPGTAPRALLGDRLIYLSVRNPSVEQNGILSIGLDVGTRNLIGEPVELERGVESRVDGGATVSLSASGTLVYRTQPDPRSQLVSLSMDGRTRVLVATERHYLHPRLSPDGNHLVATVDPPGSAPNQIMVFDLRSAYESRLTTDSVAGYFPEWTADGRHVLFTGPRNSLWRRAADRSTSAEPVTGMTGGVDYSVSRDGRKAVIRVNLSSMARDLAYRDFTQDTSLRPLVVGPENTFGPRLSPDGRWVTYWAGDPGPSEVYVTPFPGPGPRHQVSASGGYGPVWSPDGRRVYYQHDRRLFSATLAMEPHFAVVQRGEVVGAAVDPGGGYHANFDVMPDGRGFVFPRRVDPPAVWFVTHGWHPAIRSRANQGGRR